MRIAISEVKELLVRVLLANGFPGSEADLMAKVFLEAELCGRSTHGLSKLHQYVTKMLPALRSPEVNKKEVSLELVNETASSLGFDANYKTGYFAFVKSLEVAIPKAATSNVLAVSIRNTAPSSGYLSAYARMATDSNLIFNCFVNSGERIPAAGGVEALWGTNPIVYAFPAKGDPVIHDFATSIVSNGYLSDALLKGEEIELGLALGRDGSETTDPEEALKGAMIPIAGHKGAGLAYSVELFSGALTGSKVGKEKEGGWGIFYTLINPAAFRPIEDYLEAIERSKVEIKNSKKKDGVAELFFPGERSSRLRSKNLENGYLDLDEVSVDSLRVLS